jgi:hypothetical protein
MKRLHTSVVVAVAFLLIGASTAHAVSYLYTAPQSRNGRTFSCYVLNTGSRSATVNTQAIDVNGNLFESGDQELASGGVGGFSLPAGTLGPVVHCKFIVTVGNRLLLRASSCVWASDGLACAAPTEAR